MSLPTAVEEAGEVICGSQSSPGVVAIKEAPFHVHTSFACRLRECSATVALRW